MKVFRMLGRGVRDAFKSAARNFSLSIAAISCISITLLIVAIAMIGSLNVDNFTKNIKEDVTMIVFVNSKATDIDVERIDEEIRKISNVESVIYKSKAEQKAEMMKESDFFKTVMESWEEGESPLKDSFQVKVIRLEEISETAKRIKQIDLVEVVNYGEVMVDQMLSAFSFMEKLLVLIVVVLVFVTIILIINTIKLTIFSRQEAISIMRLVGSSNLNIKLPFVIEGMILGLIGSIIPVLFVIYGYIALYNRFDGIIFSQLIKLVPPYPFVFYISLVIALFGVLVGMLGSSQAVRKYLKI